MENTPWVRGCLYGPQPSPQLGETLWINPLPGSYKLCSFNCLYCRFGESDKIAADVTPYLSDLPSAEKILADLKERLAFGVEFDTVVLSGNGEPTLRPDFADLVKKINSFLRSAYPGKTIGLLSNGSGLVRKDVFDSLESFDLPIFKFDTGKPSTFHRINRPSLDVVYEDIFEQLRKIGPRVHLQSVFVGGLRGNMNEADIIMWQQAVADIKPKSVEIYSIKNAIPENAVDVVPLHELDDLAFSSEKKTGVPITAFGNWE